MNDRLRIGEIARRADCQVDTIRYYVSQGLLPEPTRTSGNFRLFEEADVERVRFIRYCRSLDMSLAEVRVLLRLRDNPEDECHEVVDILDRHVELVARRIKELQSLEDALIDLRSCCGFAGVARNCGILRSLEHAAEEHASAASDDS